MRFPPEGQAAVGEGASFCPPGTDRLETFTLADGTLSPLGSDFGLTKYDSGPQVNDGKILSGALILYGGEEPGWVNPPDDPFAPNGIVQGTMSASTDDEARTGTPVDVNTACQSMWAEMELIYNPANTGVDGVFEVFACATPTGADFSSAFPGAVSATVGYDYVAGWKYGVRLTYPTGGTGAEVAGSEVASGDVLRVEYVYDEGTFTGTTTMLLNGDPKVSSTMHAVSGRLSAGFWVQWSHDGLAPYDEFAFFYEGDVGVDNLAWGPL
jgi:hypothetical protein